MPRISKLDQEDALREAVRTSITRGEVLTKMGLSPTGGNYRALKEKCQETGITIEYTKDVSHLSVANTRPDEEVFCENSTYVNRASLKRRMIRDHGFEYKCTDCGLEGEWNGKPLVLALEHKNGIRNDNRLDNLCFLCPNCHSQTGTYAGRNLNQKGRFCVECDTWITASAKNCPNKECWKSGNWRKSPRPEREKIAWLPTADLTALVAEHGYSKAGRILGVSDNAIRKRIRTHPA